MAQQDDGNYVAPKVVAKNELAEGEPKLDINTIIHMVSDLNDEFGLRDWQECSVLTHRLLNKLQNVLLNARKQKIMEEKSKAS